MDLQEVKDSLGLNPPTTSQQYCPDCRTARRPADPNKPYQDFLYHTELQCFSGNVGHSLLEISSKLYDLNQAMDIANASLARIASALEDK